MGIEFKNGVLSYQNDILDFGFSYKLPEKKKNQKELQSEEKKNEKLLKAQQKRDRKKLKKERHIKDIEEGKK